MKIVHHALIALALTLFVPRLVLAAASEGTVTCKDGTTAAAGRGACHGHGGVDKSAAAAGAETAKPAASGAAESTVTCKDGTTGPGGRGACKGHGGVDKAATAGGAKTMKSMPAPAAASAPAAAPAPAAASKESSVAPEHIAKPAAGGKAASANPSGAIAKCKDGMYWHGTTHGGSCSHHGGVAEWLDGTQKN